MSLAHLLIVLAVAGVTLIAVAALDRVGVESAVVLVVAGLVVGFLPFVPDVSLNPEVAPAGAISWHRPMAAAAATGRHRTIARCATS